MAKEVKVGGQVYRIGRLNAFEQHHVVRRLNESGIMNSTATDEESEYVIKLCLSVVERQQGKAWAAVVTAPAKPKQHATRELLFEDLKLEHLYELTGHVIAENLGDFFLAGAPKDSAESPAEMKDAPKV